MDETRCQKMVASDGYGFRHHQCNRTIWKDGYCKQHHPDTVEARRKKRDEKWEIDRKNSLWYKLGEALKRIKELEAEIVVLKGDK